MIFFTGDTHGEIDIHKLSSENWPEGKALTKNDYLIICGDFGLVWSNPPSKTEIYDLKWLTNKPWTTLFVDGNHENHDLLEKLPVIEKFGGKVGVVSDSIFHLKRGEVFNIDGLKILAFGGAESIDKKERTVGKSWWPQEIPSYTDFENAMENLRKHDFKVDIIAAHTLPITIAKKVFEEKWWAEKINDPTCMALQRIIEMTEFDAYFCGHWHQNFLFEKYCLLYGDIISVERDIIHQST